VDLKNSEEKSVDLIEKGQAFVKQKYFSLLNQKL